MVVPSYRIYRYTPPFFVLSLFYMVKPQRRKIEDLTLPHLAANRRGLLIMCKSFLVPSVFFVRIDGYPFTYVMPENAELEVVTKVRMLQAHHQ